MVIRRSIHADSWTWTWTWTWTHNRRSTENFASYDRSHSPRRFTVRAWLYNLPMLHHPRVLATIRFAALVALVGSLGPPIAEGKGYVDPKRDANDAGNHASPSIRFPALERYARMGTPDAFETLKKAYASPKRDSGRSRVVAAAQLARYFQRPKQYEQRKALRLAYDRPGHEWLWYTSMLVDARTSPGVDEALAYLADEEFPHELKLPILAALGEHGHIAVAEQAPTFLSMLPKKPARQSDWIETIAVSLPRIEGGISEAPVRAAADLLEKRLDDAATPVRTKVVIARSLQKLYDAKHAYTESSTWAKHRDRPVRTKKSDAARLTSVDVGVRELVGSRFAILVDASNFTDAPADKETAVRLVPEFKQPKTILELQRLLVRSILEQLKPHDHVAVIPYAHRFKIEQSGLGTWVAATAANKKIILDALYDLKREGAADLHAGLRRACSLAQGGVANKDMPIDDKVMLSGFDTLIALSASPTQVDSWVAKSIKSRRAPARTLPLGLAAWGAYPDPALLSCDLAYWRRAMRAEFAAIALHTAHPAQTRVIENASVSSPLGDLRHGWDTLLRPRSFGESDDAFGKRKKALAKQLKRPSLNKRTRGRRSFLQGADIRALETLVYDYATCKEPRPETQQTIVDMALRAFGNQGALPTFAWWRGEHQQRRDAWLWFRGLSLANRAGDDRSARTTAAFGHDLFLRAAAIRAMASQQDRELLAKIPIWTKELRASKLKPNERMLLIEAMASAFSAMGTRHDEDDYKQAALALLDTFDDKETLRRTKLTVVRHIAYGLEVSPQGLDKSLWMREVRAGGSGAGGEVRGYGPTFAGLIASGTRIAYVIDMSDSMLTPLEPREMPKVVTGAPSKPKRPEDAVDWRRVKTRFDLARALVMQSLLDLPPKTHFCVVKFGSEAEPLKCTTKLIETTPANVNKAISELYAIKPGKTGEGKHKTQVKWGSLMGETNLHGGIAKALTRTLGKSMSGYVYINKKGNLEGCDSIFVLSDGAPTVDDFVKNDKRDPNDHAVVDRETGIKAKDTPTLNYPGPYASGSGDFMLDLFRRNFFRHCEIHCIGIGEAKMGLLHRIARVGLGKARKLGEDKK